MWEGFAEATLTGQDAARKMGRQLAAQTPPVRLARRARHRKPVRRRGVITKGIFLSFSFAAALACTFGHPQASAPALGGNLAAAAFGPAQHPASIPAQHSSNGR